MLAIRLAVLRGVGDQLPVRHGESDALKVGARRHRLQVASFGFRHDLHLGRTGQQSAFESKRHPRGAPAIYFVGEQRGLDGQPLLAERDRIDDAEDGR